MGDRTPRLLAIVLAVLLGMCGVLIWQLVSITRTEDALKAATPVPTTIARTNAAELFVDAWTRDQRATYTATAEVGLTGGGVRAFTDDRISRRDGRTLIERNGTLIFRGDGETETCRRTPDNLFCTPRRSIATVEEEVAELSDLVLGDAPRYFVRSGGTPGCFELELDLSRGPMVPDYGLASSFCYDADTGGLTSRTVERVNRMESYEASEISAEVDVDALRQAYGDALVDRLLGAGVDG